MIHLLKIQHLDIYLVMKGNLRMTSHLHSNIFLIKCFATKRDKYYHLLTIRITKLLYHQDIELSLFVFYSPSDDDFHIRPRFSYDITDHWKITCGFNIFGGKDSFTPFGQLKRNDNLYFRIRYSF